MGELIEHVMNARRLLRECYSVCKYGGSLLITAPNIASLKNRMLLLFGKYWRPFWGTDADTHIHFFTFNSLTEYVEGMGFKVKAAKGVGIEILRGAHMIPADNPRFYRFFPKTCRRNILLLAKK